MGGGQQCAWNQLLEVGLRMYCYEQHHECDHDQCDGDPCERCFFDWWYFIGVGDLDDLC